MIWTPVALVLALGWPALMLRHDEGLARTVVIAGAMAFALGFVTLGGAWAIGKPPRTRRAVILHLLFAGAVAALAAPFVFETLVRAVVEAGGAEGGEAERIAALPPSFALAMAPLALLLGLPVTLFSGLVFSWVALVKPPAPRRGEPALAPAHRRKRENIDA